jgi:DNA-binding CsgD family transcriptional regulator
MTPFEVDLLDLIENLNGCRTEPETVDTFGSFLSAEEFPVFAARTIENLDVVGDDTAKAPEVYTGEPEWRDEWIARGLIRHDPNALRVLTTQSAFTWASTYKISKGFGRRILDQAAEHGFRHGLNVPVHSYSKLPGVVSISGERANDLTTKEMQTLSLVCSHFFVKWSSFHNFKRDVPSLTPRERDLLCFMQSGLSGETLASKMGVSQNTSRNHMANIRAKLGAKNMTHAVAIAIHHGIISP